MIFYEKQIQVALVDDHVSLRNSLAASVSRFKNCSVLFEADHGEHMKTFILKHYIPDIILLDIDMPVLDGFDSAIWLTKNYPQIKIVTLSMNVDEKSIVKMIRFGSKSFIDKASKLSLIEEAIHAVMLNNFFMPPNINDKLIRGMQTEKEELLKPEELTDTERRFLVHCCSELTYNQIAKLMFVSPRTAEDYRYNLYKKLKVSSRTGLTLYAIKTGLVKEPDL